MAQRIDRFIEAMFRKKAEHLLFGTGTPVRIRLGDEEKVILDKAVRTEQIIKLLVPISEGQTFDSEGEKSFHYVSPLGRVHVRVLLQGDRISAIISPQIEAVYEDYSQTGDVGGLSIDMEATIPPRPSALESNPPISPYQEELREKTYRTSDVSVAPRSPPDVVSRQATVIPEAASGIKVEPARVEHSGIGQYPPAPGSDSIDGPLSESERSVGRGPSTAEPAGVQHPPAVFERSVGRGPSTAEPAGVQHPPAVIQRRPQPRPRSTSRPKVFAIDAILKQLVEQGGSDLHLTAAHQPMIRKDGDMKVLEGWGVLSSETIESWLVEAAHEGARDDFYQKNDSDFAHEIEGVARFRVNMFRDRQGVGGVMRTIPSKILTADQLNLPDVIRRMCTLPKGLVLVTGPTGSGKSTTLAAMIDLINETRHDHIITIEDPVEFVHKSKQCLVNQREVGTHTQSFGSALRAALREDPDIVLVGEMRDLETVHIAIETAETGHLVFGTLHTNTAPSTVDRIIDQFPSDQQAQIRVMLSESLRGVVSQTLLRKQGGGRVAALEILVVNNAVANLIREGKTFQIPSVMQTAKAQGMQTQTDALMNLVSSELVTPTEAIARAVDANAIKSALQRAGHTVN